MLTIARIVLISSLLFPVALYGSMSKSSVCELKDQESLQNRFNNLPNDTDLNVLQEFFAFLEQPEVLSSPIDPSLAVVGYYREMSALAMMPFRSRIAALIVNYVGSLEFSSSSRIGVALGSVVADLVKGASQANQSRRKGRNRDFEQHKLGRLLVKFKWDKAVIEEKLYNRMLKTMVWEKTYNTQDITFPSDTGIRFLALGRQHDSYGLEPEDMKEFFARLITRLVANYFSDFLDQLTHKESGDSHYLPDKVIRDFKALTGIVIDSMYAFREIDALLCKESNRGNHCCAIL